MEPNLERYVEQYIEKLMSPQPHRYKAQSVNRYNSSSSFFSTDFSLYPASLKVFAPSCLSFWLIIFGLWKVCCSISENLSKLAGIKKVPGTYGSTSSSYGSDLEFVNVEGAQVSSPRNRVRQPM